MSNQIKTKLAFGALLHDIGKVVYRGDSEKGNHSVLGAKFIEEQISVIDVSYDSDIIAQIRYHHAMEMRSANIASSSLAYITYFADNISASMDRKNEGEDSGFDREAKLRKIFNILSGRKDDNTYPLPNYNKTREDVKNGLKAISVDYKEINSLLSLLEATLDKVPSSTNKSELIDVSLFDHVKTTAAIAVCLYEFLNERDVTDYKSALFDISTSQQYYDEKMFLLYSCDMSGIQNFIYNISGEGALKQLRSRSFYLEMCLEHIVDELLERLGLSRCNLLYTGGGHSYMLLPNTAEAKDTISRFEQELKTWFLQNYKTELYVAGAYVSCSGNDLANEGNDKKRYKKLYSELSTKLSIAKLNRYTAKEIADLNFAGNSTVDYSRECKECHRSDTEINEDGICSRCASFASISDDIVNKNIFVIADEGMLILPLGKKLSVITEAEYLQKKPEAYRIYTKNDWHTGIGLSTHIWMGDYRAKSKNGIGGYANYSQVISNIYGQPSDGKKQTGVKRLGILRADVDNLGALFSAGLPDDKISISRTSTLSRALSFFFKSELNDILEASKYQAQIVYSGGDDLFIIGNWFDIIFAAIDIKNKLKEFTGNDSLTISAGIGIFEPKYPLAQMADQTGQLEDNAKEYKSDSANNAEPTKNAVALWTESKVFSWDDFENNIIGNKLNYLRQVFDNNEKGKSFIYKLIALLRDNSQIRIARLAYLLARSFEGNGNNDSAISKKLFEWAMDKRECIFLETALELYVYSIRDRD